MRFLTRILPVVAAFLAVACSSTKKPDGSAAGPVRSGVVVRGVAPDGNTVDLSDGSLWLVQPAGQSATLHWRPGQPVQPQRSGHPSWPFVLTDPMTGAAALARHLGGG